MPLSCGMSRTALSSNMLDKTPWGIIFCVLYIALSLLKLFGLHSIRTDLQGTKHWARSRVYHKLHFFICSIVSLFILMGGRERILFLWETLRFAMYVCFGVGLLIEPLRRVEMVKKREEVAYMGECSLPRFSRCLWDYLK